MMDNESFAGRLMDCMTVKHAWCVCFCCSGNTEENRFGLHVLTYPELETVKISDCFQLKKG